MLNRDDTERLAAMAAALRPDWPIKSLVTFISTNLTTRTYRETAVALTWVATDPLTATPKRVIEAGPWWNATRAEGPTVSVIPTRCGEHPTYPAHNCPDCAQASTADDATREAHLEAMRRAIRDGNTQRRKLKKGTQ